MSLNADAVIAVSAAGFTAGAIAKAKAFGIILRDIHTLTEEEISSWGRLTSVSLTFYEFKNVGLVFLFARKDLTGLRIENIEEYLRSSPDQLYGIFQTVCNRIDENDPKSHPGKIAAQLEDERLRIAGRPVVTTEFSTNFFLGFDWIGRVACQSLCLSHRFFGERALFNKLLWMCRRIIQEEVELLEKDTARKDA
jgi:hypothetical protein